MSYIDYLFGSSKNNEDDDRENVETADDMAMDTAETEAREKVSRRSADHDPSLDADLIQKALKGELEVRKAPKARSYVSDVVERAMAIKEAQKEAKEAIKKKFKND